MGIIDDAPQCALGARVDGLSSYPPLRYPSPLGPDGALIPATGGAPTYADASGQAALDAYVRARAAVQTVYVERVVEVPRVAPPARTGRPRLIDRPAWRATMAAIQARYAGGEALEAIADDLQLQRRKLSRWWRIWREGSF